MTGHARTLSAEHELRRRLAVNGSQVDVWL